MGVIVISPSTQGVDGELARHVHELSRCIGAWLVRAGHENVTACELRLIADCTVLVMRL